MEKKVIVHRIKPDNPGKPPKPDSNDKYWYKVSSLTWNNPNPQIQYEINLEGSGLGPSAASAIATCFETWDDTTNAELFSNSYTASVLEAGVRDYHNVLSFGIEEPGIIAVTTIWSISGQIVEIDVLFNTYYPWTQNGAVETNKMDLENIATHEIGHWLVLEDLYNRPARSVTMYGYSTYGETIKETLEADDIKGVQVIYGP